MATPLKKCKRCRKEKPLTLYQKAPAFWGYPDGRHRICMPCLSRSMKRARKKKRESGHDLVLANQALKHANQDPKAALHKKVGDLVLAFKEQGVELQALAVQGGAAHIRYVVTESIELE